MALNRWPRRQFDQGQRTTGRGRPRRAPMARSARDIVARLTRRPVSRTICSTKRPRVHVGRRQPKSGGVPCTNSRRRARNSSSSLTWPLSSRRSTRPASPSRQNRFHTWSTVLRLQPTIRATAVGPAPAREWWTIMYRRYRPASFKRRNRFRKFHWRRKGHAIRYPSMGTPPGGPPAHRLTYVQRGSHFTFHCLNRKPTVRES